MVLAMVRAYSNPPSLLYPGINYLKFKFFFSHASMLLKISHPAPIIISKLNNAFAPIIQYISSDHSPFVLPLIHLISYYYWNISLTGYFSQDFHLLNKSRVDFLHRCNIFFSG